MEGRGGGEEGEAAAKVETEKKVGRRRSKKGFCLDIMYMCTISLVAPGKYHNIAGGGQ